MPGATILARQLRLMLESHHFEVEGRAIRVFMELDTDGEVDTLAFNARCDTENMLLLITVEFFHRPLCALQVTVAYTNNVPIIPIICYLGQDPVDRFEIPSKSTYKTITLADVVPDAIPEYSLGFWTTNQLLMFRKSGVPPAFISQAYAAISKYTLVPSDDAESSLGPSDSEDEWIYEGEKKKAEEEPSPGLFVTYSLFAPQPTQYASIRTLLRAIDTVSDLSVEKKTYLRKSSKFY